MAAARSPSTSNTTRTTSFVGKSSTTEAVSRDKYVTVGRTVSAGEAVNRASLDQPLGIHEGTTHVWFELPAHGPVPGRVEPHLGDAQRPAQRPY
jgi:hypothetical protein